MKLITRIFTGLLCLSVFALTSCGSDDDNGPSEPENQGSFTGSFTNAMNENTEWTAESASAVQDTSIFGDVTITATKENGDVITILIEDTIPTVHPITTENNLSTYSTSSLSTPATTASDDTVATVGSIQITHSGISDNILEGMGSVKWVVVNADTTDSFFGYMSDISFSVPLTRVGFTGGGGGGGTGETSLSVDVDGTAFNPTNVLATPVGGGIYMVGTDNSGATSISINIPSGATLGDHDLANFGTYSVTYTSNQTSYAPSTGNLNISAYDETAGTVTGTFTCTVVDIQNPSGESHSLTNGSFSVD